MSIHIIDDEAVISEILSSALSEHSKSIRCFQSAEAYLTHMQSTHYREPRLIITDVVMNGISGFELVRHIRNNKLKARIIVMSGFFHDPHSYNPTELGIDAILCKPFNMDELQTIVSNIIASDS